MCLMLSRLQGVGAGLTVLTSHKSVREERWERAERQTVLKQGTG